MHILMALCAAVGFVLFCSILWDRTGRWMDREFRHALVLRWTIVALAGALMLTAVLAAFAHGAAFDALCAIACVLMLPLFFVLIASPYLRRTVVSASLRPRRILAIGAHPDDLELACGATLAKLIDEGHEVRTMVMSRGSFGGAEETRVVEARNGSRYLGAASTTVLDLEDSRLELHDREMIQAIEAMIRDFAPDVVLTHSANDYHQDHDAVHKATLRAARRAPSILCFESPSATRDFSPGFFVDVSSHLEVKVRAIELHRDQRRKPYMTGARTRAVAAFRGDQARVPFAEGFEVVRLAGSSIGDF